MIRGARVTVAGAGALGLTTALALAEAGCIVTVCDPEKSPRASSIAAGMLAPVFEAVLDPETAKDLDLLLASRNLWPGLAQRFGIGLDRSGAAAVGSRDWLAEIHARLIRLGLRGSDLPRAMLEDIAPGLAPELCGLLVREDWRLEPTQALKALRQSAAAAGVAFRAETVRQRGAADWLIVATGAGQSLVAAAPELVGVSPIKGQILRFMDQRGGRVSLRTEHAYAAPNSAGLAIGATMEPGRSDTEIDLHALKPLSEAVGRLFPSLEEATFGVAVGVRAATRDGLPMVGFSQAPGVILAVGARRNGWLLAPLVAGMVTAFVTGSEPGPYASRLDPARFETGRAP